MNRYTCNDNYSNDMKEYTEQVLVRNGQSSPTAEREIMCLAEKGNSVARLLLADMIFYKKILRRHPYPEAFRIYMESADMNVAEDGSWYTNGAGYPLSFWVLGYYLVNYRRESFLRDCEQIPEIENMTIESRLSTALSLAVSCICYTKAAGAVNLMGRILREVAEDPELFENMKQEIRSILQDEADVDVESDSPEDYLKLADTFFRTAAEEGYVYACNNLAAKEADRIITIMNESASHDKEAGAEKDNEEKLDGATVTLDEDELKGCIERYIKYLKLSADKYEPYAANRLGLFYRTGEIIGSSGKTVCRDYIDSSLAKEYFIKATRYPDANSAWAYLNLIKYYHKDYDNDIDLMNDHMDYIKELNPAVYDIAMDL